MKEPSEKPEVSVVLPLYRTASVLGDLHNRLTAVLRTMDRSYEIIYVDDACPEGSGGLVERLVNREGGIVLFKHVVNQGQAWAVYHGLQRASGDKIVIMDADLQDEPEHLPGLFEELTRGGVEAVFAGRTGAYQATSRMKTSRVFKWLMCLVLGVPRDAGSYVVMTRRMADTILRVRSRFPYMLALIGGTRLPVRSIPVLRAARPSGQSAYGDWARLKMAYRGLRAAVEVRWMNSTQVAPPWGDSVIADRTAATAREARE